MKWLLALIFAFCIHFSETHILTASSIYPLWLTIWRILLTSRGLAVMKCVIMDRDMSFSVREETRAVACALASSNCELYPIHCGLSTSAENDFCSPMVCEQTGKSLLPVGIKLLCLFLHMHQDQQKTQLEFFWTHILLPQDIGKLMNPSIDALNRFPIGLRALKRLVQKML